MLPNRDRFIEIGEVTEAPKPASEREPEATETPRLVGVTIWGESDGLLLNRDCVIKISKLAKTLKPT